MSNNEYGFGNGYTQDGNTTVTLGGEQATPSSPAMAVKDITTQEFMTEVIEASAQIPVLVDFWATWCGPCKQLAPALEKAVAATRGKVKLVKMDVDKHPEVPGQMGIQSLPTVVAFVNGRPADMFMGVKSEGDIRDFITKVAGPDEQQNQIELMLEKAEELAEQGALGEAGSIYGQILTVEPQNLKALSAIGHLYLNDKNVDGARGIIASLDEKLKESPEVASLISAIELAKQAEELGDHLQLKSDVEANPNDHQKRLELAIAMNAAGMREEAADHLLEIIKRNPGWNEDAARGQLLQFFEAWGMTDEVTVSSRRKLSSLLFS
ncbi:MAG: thioredoxin [Pseudomonadota bacterium]